jgi:hypothetical protein
VHRGDVVVLFHPEEPIMDEKRLLEWLRRELFWQVRERKLANNASLKLVYSGSVRAFQKTIKWVKFETGKVHR